MIAQHFVETVLAGFCVGILVGSTGVGGGSIMAPILLLVFKMNPLIAVGTDLFYNVPTKIIGAISHARQGTLNVSVSLYLSCGGIIGAVLAAFILRNLAKHVGMAALSLQLRHWIGLAICLSAILTVVPLFTRRALENQPEITPNRFLLVVLGGIVGTIVMTTSVGAGAITMPLLCLLLQRSKMAALVGSDLAFSALVTGFGAVLYFSAGLVNLPFSLTLLLGSIPGVILGSRLSFHIADRFLRPAVGSVLFFVGLRFI